MLSFVMSLVVISVTVSGAPESAPLKGADGSSTEQGVHGYSQPGGEQAASVTWSGDYGKALAMARASGKPLIVLIEKSDDPSHRVDVAETFGASDHEGVTAKFELCRVDASTQYGQELAKSFGVYQFPFTAVSTRDGTRIAYRRQGPITSDQLRSALATVQNHTVLRPSLDAENVLTPWDGSASVRGTSGASAPGNCPNCRLR